MSFGLNDQLIYPYYLLSFSLLLFIIIINTIIFILLIKVYIFILYQHFIPVVLDAKKKKKKKKKKS